MFKRVLWLFLLVVTFTSSLALHAQQAELQPVRGIRAKDGDTIVVEFPDGTREQVRYASINAPGLDQCLGAEAQRENEALIKGKALWLELNPTNDGYERAQDRLLAHVFLTPVQTPSSSVSVLLVAQGLARLDVREPVDREIREGKDFDAQYADWIVAVQTEAAKARRGWWGVCDDYAESELLIAAIKQWSDDEIVYIVNRGSESVNLAAEWKLRDASGSERNALDFSDYLIGKCLLPPGGLLLVHSGSVATGRGGEHAACGEPEMDFYWTGYTIWDQDKDEAWLYDPEGGLIYDYVYPLDWD